MMPASLCQRETMHLWPSVQVRFQVRRARPRSQRMVRAELATRFILGARERVKWRTEVTKRETRVRRETERSWGLLDGSGKENGGIDAYNEECPGDVVMFFVEVVDEEDEDYGHNE